MLNLNKCNIRKGEIQFKTHYANYLY